ncbi:hypothetical protein B484DRAFT_446087 [Ochromonadaceae sp. CCMP2298]|nr:hypothetical protein B484DRAFT_446087 [Ochromonadaceae sp. CCMP2298]|eukprot:CAMPEP_0173205490 /NCGR_PEP_ID=MMETSP1141-20130122/20779_1 /TAXON_ID=483371 /ORGANISM="non described non described, Strain CCMP2298" /LENGTH=323 /DNA_ID=CAMNT_0014131415 /DNA_START=11 /DNA_END=982 /DNA_ORIENTATION=+
MARTTLLLLACLVLLTTTYAKVLVIGATGRVGSTIVSSLLAHGVPTNILVRDMAKAAADKRLEGCQMFQGDMTSTEALIEACKDCDAVIDVHGVKNRFTKARDLFLHPRGDPTHPYNVNFLGTKRVLAAMAVNKVPKIVRITGALVDTNPFSPFIVLFNCLLAKSNKWHQMSEKAIRESGVDYTVLRPTGLRTDPTTPLLRSRLLLPVDKREKFKVPAQIAVADVAALCVLASQSQALSKATVICSTKLTEEGVVESKSWEELVAARQDWQDTRKIVPSPHNLALLLYTSILSALLAALGRLFFVAARGVARCFVKGAVRGAI